MSFWSAWIFLLTLLFIGWLYRLFRQLYRDNETANFDNAVAEFDGIEERDAPLPPWVIKSFIGIFIFLAAYLVLMPGVYRGIISSQEELTPAASDSHKLAATIDALQGDETVSLLDLANDGEIRHAGQNLFETHCGSCHGMDAEGNKSFPNLVDDDWVYGDSDESLLFTLTHGRSYAMPGYENILSYEDIENVRKYLFSLNPERPLEVTRVEIEQGQTVYQQSSCPICHGVDAKGYSLFGGYNLTDNIWVYGGDVSDVRHSITKGHLGEMPAFKDRLDKAEILAVAAYLRLLGQQKKEQLAALDPELLERGKYLAAAGDCVSCHSGQGGEPFGGGLPFATPFGTMYSTNISTSRAFGIGAFSYQHFYNALKKGHTRKGFLFPAMPFTSFQHIDDDDIEALWTYQQSLTPVHKPNQPLKMIFPTNIRLGQLGWQTLFMDKDELEYPQARSESWRRGKYLTWGLGHCTECHTPRNFIMAMKTDEPFQGAIMEGLQAPDITATELYRGDWTVDDLHDFLKNGQSRKGTPFGVMADVVKNSTRYLSDSDVRAIATYLTEGDVNNELDTRIAPVAPQGIPENHSDENNEQYQVYIRTCGNCHGKDGRGVDGGVPPLLNNGILTHSDPRNLIAVSLRGVSPSFMTPDTHFQDMSGFESMLMDGDLAKLLSYVRFHLGGQNEPISREQVKRVREYLEDKHFDTPIHGHSTAEEQPEPASKTAPLDKYTDY
jgi:thiosulfate dehydrogenase